MGILDVYSITNHYSLQAEKTNAARVHKLLEFLMFCPRLTTFDDMCAALMTCPGDLSWLAKELQTDVRADRGNLVIDYDVMKEAAMLTHRFRDINPFVFI